MSLTCVRKQRMVVAVIVEFGPHAQRELLHVRQLRLVVNVLRKEESDRYSMEIGSVQRSVAWSQRRLQIRELHDRDTFLRDLTCSAIAEK